MGRFDGQVVWITGGGSGIGSACAVEFARQGAKVAVSGRRTEKLTETVQAIEAVGGTALAVVCDVTDPSACDNAVATILEAFGQIDVCVANAGYAVGGWLAKMSMQTWRTQFETNVFGLLHTVYAALPHVQERRGRLVLVSSIAGFFSPPKLVAYAASKHAVRSIGEGLSIELHSRGVSVTTICPGWVQSEIQQVDNAGQFDPDRPTKKNPMSWSAERAARSIVSAVHRRKVIAPITGHAHVIILLSRLFPGLMRLVLRRG